jgi:bifunctional non-homologous end joining protein LigD
MELPGPITTPPAADGHRFVVQRHRATRLHYDLRLEIGGVLVSWAVPRGPTLDPDVRRLAVRVDDHDLAHIDVEAVFGRGDTIVWDWGRWSTDPGVDAATALAAGDLHVDLDGAKLQGRFALIRRGRERGRDQWLLVHKHDADAIRGWDPEAHRRSVKSGLTNEELRGDA